MQVPMRPTVGTPQPRLERFGKGRGDGFRRRPRCLHLCGGQVGSFASPPLGGFALGIRFHYSNAIVAPLAAHRAAAAGHRCSGASFGGRRRAKHCSAVFADARIFTCNQYQLQYLRSHVVVTFLNHARTTGGLMLETDITTSQVLTMYAGIFVFFLVLIAAWLKKNS